MWPSDLRAVYHMVRPHHGEPWVELSSARFNVPLDTIGHFGDESSQAINYTGTDNKKITN